MPSFVVDYLLSLFLNSLSFAYYVTFDIVAYLVLTLLTILTFTYFASGYFVAF